MNTGTRSGAGGTGGHGPLHGYLTADHERLEGHLTRAVAGPDGIEPEEFHRFRAGILRHIGIEEKILMPEAKRLRCDVPLEVAARLRKDHSAIATLLVATPTRPIVAAIVRILEAHNPLEEAEGAMYDQVEALLPPAEAEALLDRVRATPDPPLAPYSDNPRVLERIAGIIGSSNPRGR